MNKKYKILSAFLAILMMLSVFSGLSVIGVAADTGSTEKEFRQYYGKELIVETPEKKLELMDLMYTQDGYEMYVLPQTGEVAVKEIATGQILFTNPYDAPSSIAKIEGPMNLLFSQIIIEYRDKTAPTTTGEPSTATLNSFQHAAALQQLSVSRIKNGVRVEYSIGTEATRKLVPRSITAERFEEYILGPLTAAVEAGATDINMEMYEEGYGYYSKLSIEGIKNQEYVKELIEKYPILATDDIWVLTLATEAELDMIESNITKYCSDYTFEMMDDDHEETDYVGLNKQYALFKLALEYSLTEDGMVVRLPANGLRYDTASFILDSIQVLPYLGAGHSHNGGYIFFPDGSGTLFDLDELKKSALTYSQPVYGIDYAYNNMEQLGYRTPVRYPVYGVVANEQFYTYSYSYEGDDGATVNVGPIRVSSTVKSLEKIKEEASEKNAINLVIDDSENYSRGYVAVVESGDALTSLSAYLISNESEYGTVLNRFSPVPNDKKNLSGNATPVDFVSRKFTGSLKIQYKMLSDKNVAQKAVAADPTYVAYDTTWLGMAEYYRDYLIKNGTLKELTNDDVEKDIPLYLEVFGAMETQQMIMTLPVYVMTPLTTFENIAEMFDQLSKENVTNINFKMTGFANGGMYSTVPAGLKWEKAVGGKSGFKDLIEKAKEVNEGEEDLHLGLYPDFDFAYISSNTLFDRTNLKKDAVTAMDNRYTSKRVYSASQQMYVTFHQMIVSPARFDKFYTKLMDKYGDYDISSISIGSLGNALNSDFDKDEPTDREGSKEYTMQALEAIKNSNDKKYDIMVDSGNAYTWAYANHIINLDLDSSRHNNSSAAVPFIGAVLHGSIQFTGTPLNEEGNIDNAILKALENGANLYFILSYQNTTYLKEDIFLSQYYSVRYDIWQQDVVKYYNQLNNLLKDVQTKEIIGHEFLNDSVERIMDLDEINEQIEADLAAAMEAANKKHSEASLYNVTTIADARAIAATVLQNRGNMAKLTAYLADVKAANDTVVEKYNALKTAVDGFETFRDEQIALIKAGDTTAIETIENKINEIKGLAVDVMKASYKIKSQSYNATKLAAAMSDGLTKAKTVIAGVEDLDASVKAGYLAEIDAAENEMNTYATNLGTEVTKNVAYYDGQTVASADLYAESVLAKIVVDDADVVTALEGIKTKCEFTADAILAEGKFNAVESDDDNTAGGSNSNNSNVYAVDKNTVVAVTYGDITTNDAGTTQKTPFKTFLLNYNSYAVRLTYNGILYTIPAGGYIVLYN